MKDEFVTNALLRRFLLREVGDEECRRIERLFITDSQTRERVLIVEQELIDEYLENSLTASEREKFLSQYAQTPAQQQKLRITKSIKDWAMTETAATPIAAAPVSTWSRLRAWLRPMFVVPVAVAIVIAMIVAVVWLNSRRQRNNQHLAIEHELAQLNTRSSLREVPPGTPVLNLSPVTVRGGAPQTELKKQTNTQFIELRLHWIQNERYRTYQAVIRRLGDEERFTIRDLEAESDGNAIRIKLSHSFLSRGNYQIQLAGVAADGAIGLVEEYTFGVDG
jgi:hypothetical protein